MASVYIRNRCFNPRLGKTPYEALISKQPNLSNMHVFESTCYSFVQNAKKLDAHSQKGIFVGYDKGSPAYLVFYPETNKVEKIRCVKFIDNFQGEQDEHDLISNRERGENTVMPEAKIPNINEEQNTQEFEIEQVGGDKDIHEQHKQDIYAERYPTRACNKPNYFGLNKLDDNTSYTVDYCYRLANIPVSYKQAVDAPDANRWQEAMNIEMKALTDNETFELVPHPKDRQVVGAKWLYTVKENRNIKPSL
jgi:hypothetical protein